VRSNSGAAEHCEGIVTERGSGSAHTRWLGTGSPDLWKALEMEGDPEGQPRDGLGPSGVTEAIAAGYREILPSSFQVETNGPLLNVQSPGVGHMFFGNFVLHILFLSARYRLEQFAKIAFGDLPDYVGRAARLSTEMTWPAVGTTCYSKVTKKELRIWFGHSSDESAAVLTVRPIPRAELGVRSRLSPGAFGIPPSGCETMFCSGRQKLLALESVTAAIACKSDYSRSG
jgi:hypothetical protein